MRTHKILKYILLLVTIVNYAQQSEKPNILWIVTDDQRVDSNGFYNKIVSGENNSPLGFVSSPNLDALAKEGVVFTNMYCNSPACAPSRGSMVNGKYPHHNGVYGFERAQKKTTFTNKSMPQVLADNGYETSVFGKAGYRLNNWGPGLTWNDAGFYQKKIDYKNDLRAVGFTDWYKRPIYEKINGKNKTIGTQTEFYFPNGESKKFFMEKKIGKLSEDDILKRAYVEEKLDILYSYTRSQSTLIIGGVSPQPKDETIDANILKEYISYLKNQDIAYKTLSGKDMEGADSSKPIFTSLGFHFPHTPILPPKEFRNQFKGKVYKIPEFEKSEVAKLPKQLQDLYAKLQIDGLKYEEKQQAIRDYYAFCAFGDYLIGKAITAFKTYCAKNKQEYMIVYICGDHGWHLGEQGIEAKFAPWKLSTHNSGIVATSNQKNFVPGTVYKGFAEYVDIMPTVLAAGGVDITTSEFDYLDGFNMAELIKDKSLKKEYIFGEINSVAGPRAYLRSEDFAFSMRTRPLNGIPGNRYQPNENVRWGIDAPREEVQMALYDLRIDPNERNNIANDKNYIQLADWFRNKLGNIVLGDGRIECNWKKENDFNRSEFALGADDKKIDIPKNIIPQLK